MDQASVESLHNLLLQSTASNTGQIQAATAQLNQEYYKNPACIPALATIIASSPHEAVRQLAAVEMRKRVAQNSGDFWTRLDQTDREQIKVKLPELVLADHNKLVRHSTARVIAAIASVEMPAGTWPQLLPFLHQTATSPQVNHREVGVFILFAVLENIVDGFQDHMASLFELFQRLLHDPESLEVRVTTVRALGTVAQYIDIDDKADIKAFQAMLPALIAVIAQTVEAGDEQSARHLFDVLEILLILEIPVLSAHIPELVQFLLACGSNRAYENEMRIFALNALNWTIQYKKSKIQSLNLAPKILDTIMMVVTEDMPGDMDEDAPGRSALRIVDRLATSLPPSQVFPALRTLLQQYFSSPEPSNRRAAMLALGVSVEGCSEFMTPLMNHIWPVVEAGLQDADPGVRTASCTAVSCLCEWLEEECSSKHSVLLPVIMNLVNDPSTQKYACTALDALLEIMHEVIDQYLPLIMDRLAGLLDTAPVAVKAVVTGAIGSAAHASKANFLSYFQPTMERLKHFLVLQCQAEGEEELRGISMDAVGTLAEAVGKEAFRPYFADMMTQAFQGTEMGSARLRECSFLFFGVMAKVFEEEFAPYLQTVIPQLIASCEQEENGSEPHNLSVADASAAFATGSTPSTAIPVDGIQAEDVEDVDTDKMLEVNSAIAVEKEIAADTLGVVFAATRNHFLPYVEQSTLVLQAMLPHYYEGIRKSASDALLEIVRTFFELSGGQEWQPGVSVELPLDQHVKELIDHVLPALLDMHESEDDKSVVSALCIGLAETINKIGPAFFDGHLETISALAVQIFEQKALCQQDPDQDDAEEAPDDQAEYDSVLISAAGDLVASLSNALGHAFAQAFDTFFPLIAKYYKKSRSLSDRSSAIGSLAEITAGMKTAVTPWTEPLMDLFYNALGDPDAEVLSNAAFASGLLVEYSDINLSAQYLPLLAALRPLFGASPNEAVPRLTAKDNAAGAVGRMIVKNIEAVPLDQVLPIFVDALPLKHDKLENRPVFRAIFHVFRSHPQVISPYLPQLFAVFAYVLDPSAEDQLPEDIRVELLSLIAALNAENSSAVQAAGLQAFLPGA